MEAGIMRGVLALAALAVLTGCMGDQTGKALNAFDSKSFWYSGYDDSDVHDSSGWTMDHGDSGAHSDAGHSDAGSMQ